MPLDDASEEQDTPRPDAGAQDPQIQRFFRRLLQQTPRVFVTPGLVAVNAALFVGIVPLFIGVAALQLFPHEGGEIPAALGQNGDAVLLALVDSYAPEWLAVLTAMGLVAAAMSTIDTCANVTALSVASL